VSAPPGVPPELLFDQLAEALARRIVELQRESVPAPSLEERSPWMNIESATAYLDLPKQRLYRLTAAGAIPHYKQEGRLLFRRQELDGWLGGFAQVARS
jgi:excisionase family DNA binding protein